MREAAKIALLQPAKSVFLTEIDVVIIKIQIGSQTKPGFLPTKIHYPQFLVKLIVAIKQRCQLWLVRGDDYCYYYIYYILLLLAEGSLEVKLPTIWTDEKQRWEESEKTREEERRSKRESLRRKKIQVREKVGKSRNIVFPMICGSGGGSLKRRARSQLAR